MKASTLISLMIAYYFLIIHFSRFYDATGTQPRNALRRQK